MTRLGLAIIGLGPASEPHVKALAELSDVIDVRWAARRSPARLAAFAAQASFPTTTDITAAIHDPAVGAVLVLTPPFAHLEIAEQALAAGKHVLVEKPLEVTLDRAVALVHRAAHARLTLGVVLQHRFRAGVRRLEALLQDGALGAVQAASLTVPWWRPQAYYDEPGRGTRARDGGGVLLTQAIHALDVFRALLGVRTVVAAQIRTTALHHMETEDYASALVELGNGAPATIMATTAAYPGRPERLEVIASLGTAILEGGSLRVEYLDGRNEVLAGDARTGSGAGIMDFDHGPHRDLLADFAAAIRDRRPPRVTGEDALATQRLVDHILMADRR